MNRIRELRTAHKIKQADLAKKLQVSQGTLSYWENGIYEPDSENLKRLADYFHVTIDYLLGHTNEGMAIPFKELRKFMGLTRERAASLLNVRISDIDNWDKGTSTPNIDALKKISSELNISLDQLLGKDKNHIMSIGEDGNFYISSPQIELPSKFRIEIIDGIPRMFPPDITDEQLKKAIEKIRREQKNKPAAQGDELTPEEKRLIDLFRLVPVDKQKLVADMVEAALKSQGLLK